ncbi:MAG: hypothetical protein R6V17_05535, partial [Halanaerobacter sp.]
NKLKDFFSSSNDCRNQDEIYLNLDGLEIMVKRSFAYDKPHEVSVFVPRAEMRKKVKEGEKEEEIEVLLNSITIVHSPQRPSNEGDSLPIKPPNLKPPEPPKEKEN